MNLFPSHDRQGFGDVRIPIDIGDGALGVAPAVGQPIPINDVRLGKTAGLEDTDINRLGDTNSFTITALRVGAALKRWLENSYRGGTRYVEALWNHWAVRSSDARIQSAEYLGGGIQPMVISEVVTTAPATAQQTGVPPGYLAGHGISYGKTNRFTKKFEQLGS